MFVGFYTGLIPRKPQNPSIFGTLTASRHLIYGKNQWPGKATGETKKEKKTKQNLPKPRKPMAEPGHYIDTNV